MKATKLVIFGAAAVTLLCTFALPYLSAEGISLTLWQLRKLDVIHGYIIAGAMVIPLALGGAALKGRQSRATAILSLLGFGVALLIAFAVFSKAHASLGKDGGLGAKLMLLALVAGTGASIVGTIKPEPRA